MKSVLPALVPEMSYEKLEVGGGAEAGLTWERVIDPFTNVQEKTRLKAALLEYCKQDTLALAKLS